MTGKFVCTDKNIHNCFLKNNLIVLTHKLILSKEATITTGKEMIKNRRGIREYKDGYEYKKHIEN